LVLSGSGVGAEVVTAVAVSTLHGGVSSADKLATGDAGRDSFGWMAANILLFDSSDPALTELYSFRWYAFEKYVVHTDRYGWLTTEWLPKA